MSICNSFCGQKDENIDTYYKPKLNTNAFECFNVNLRLFTEHDFALKQRQYKKDSTLSKKRPFLKLPRFFTDRKSE